VLCLNGIISLMERTRTVNLPSDVSTGKVFENPALNSYPELTRLVQISVREGAWKLDQVIADQTKQILVMHLVDGLTFDQIGDEVGLSTHLVSHAWKSISTTLFTGSVMAIIRQSIDAREEVSKIEELEKAYLDYQQSLTPKRRGKV
jgi:hypothetical protein